VPRETHHSTVFQPQPTVPTPPTGAELADSTPTPTPPGELVGPALEPQPRIDPVPTPAVRNEAQLLTSGSAIKPPYPASKLLTEEEADLTLKLTIDEAGRVVAVEPIGRADPTFLGAARRHLLARWQFSPATEDGRPIASSTIITLRFRLD